MPPTDDASQQRVGGVYTFAAYALWGVMPVYFLLLLPTGPWELVGWRMLLSLVVCSLLLTITRGWPAVVRIVRQPKLLLWTAVAGILIYGNWQIFVLATFTERIIETSLGYFINPIFTVLLGVLLLGERLRRAQWVAIGIAAAAVTVIIAGYGRFPWIALSLAATFGVYGLVKNKIGPTVDAVSGLTLESAWLLPVAIVQLSLVAATGGMTMGTVSVGHTLLLASVGIGTALPLLLFSAGARRVPLSVIGFLQFLTPLMQFITGVWIMGEPMPLERWIGFGLVWAALLLLTSDLLVHSRRSRRAGTSDAPSDLDQAWTGAVPLPK